MSFAGNSHSLQVSGSNDWTLNILERNKYYFPSYCFPAVIPTKVCHPLLFINIYNWQDCWALVSSAFSAEKFSQCKDKLNRYINIASIHNNHGTFVKVRYHWTIMLWFCLFQNITIRQSQEKCSGVLQTYCLVIYGSEF